MSHNTENCRDIFAALSSYLDGELTAEARAELEKHLCGCPPCVEFVESLRRTVELCHEFQPADQPSPLTSQAREELLAACRKMLASRGL